MADALLNPSPGRRHRGQSYFRRCCGAGVEFGTETMDKRAHAVRGDGHWGPAETTGVDSHPVIATSAAGKDPYPRQGVRKCRTEGPLGKGKGTPGDYSSSLDRMQIHLRQGEARKGEDAIDSPRILVAHDLALYAESLATILPEFRPHLRIHLLGPEELEVLVQALTGTIVICGRLTPVVATHASGWMLFHPDRENVLVVGGNATSYRIEEPHLIDVLGAIDHLLAQSAVAGHRQGAAQSALKDNDPSGGFVAPPDHP